MVRAFLAGDESAFTEFVGRHSDGLYRMAGYWLKDSSLAADVVQDTMLRCFTGLSRFRFQAQPKTWAYRVCRNVCRETNRRTREMVTENSIELADRQQQRDESPTDMAVDHLAQTATAEAMRHQLAQLPDRQREVVVLRLLEELSVRETARIMGCREGTVKAHLAKALTNLRQLWAAADKPARRVEVAATDKQETTRGPG